jgi:hypothetical protein
MMPTSLPQPRNTAIAPESFRSAKWRSHTSAEIVSEPRFSHLKRRAQWHIVGVAGFARPWSQMELSEAELAQMIADARASLCHELADRQRRFGQRLIIASGATDQGVLQLTYEVCGFLNITAMGIAPDQALDFPLGKMRYMLPFGSSFGDESHVFVRTIDELILLGGGRQSERELFAAARVQRPITIIKGFGGVADQVLPCAIPTARFVSRFHTGWC